MTKYSVRLKVIKHTLPQETMGKLIITNMSYCANYHKNTQHFYYIYKTTSTVI